jgi:uncharacterized protein (UPF0276 family)
MNVECIGVGVNFRREIETDIIKHLDKFDLLEIITDSLLLDNGIGEALRHILHAKPVVLHGLRASLGAAEPIDRDYMQAILAAVAQWKPLWFSDHVAFSRVGSLDVGQLMPVRRTQTSMQRIVDKVRLLRNATHAPFLVENITYYFDYDFNELAEELFINRILQEADCGLLLDVNNLYINACNHRFDPYEFIEKLDLSRLTEIHMAGGFSREELLIDSHGHRISQPVWELLEFVCKRAKPRAIIIERDANFDLTDMLESVARAREILNVGELTSV